MIENLLLEITERCDCCNGSGKEEEYYHGIMGEMRKIGEKTCSHCSGIGKRLNEKGQLLRKLFSQNYYF